MPALLEQLRHWPDPAVALRTRVALDGASPTELTDLADQVRDSPDCNAIIDGCLPVARHPYRKWQGPHWALVQLAERGHPGGDPRLTQIQEHVFAWILAPSFLQPNWTRHLEGQPERVRRCGSMEGNVLWASVKLGLMDDRLRILADRLAEFQWPDGGWNCDVDPAARQSSFVETVLPLRGLAAWVGATGDARARGALERGVELLLSRELLFRRTTGAIMQPSWGPKPNLIGFPIRFFDVLLVLEVMAQTGHIADPRCSRALELLESKRTRDGGFPLEFRAAATASEIRSRGTFAQWGRGGRTRSNPWVTVAAWSVLDAAGRPGPRRTA